MSIVSGYKKFKKYILTSSGFQLVSHWTKANTLEFDDGKTAQAKLGAIDGISSSRESNSDKIAASTALVSELNSDLGGIRFGKDIRGNYGYIKDGADTVTPFNNIASYHLTQSWDNLSQLQNDKKNGYTITIDLPICKKAMLILSARLNWSENGWKYTLNSGNLEISNLVSKGATWKTNYAASMALYVVSSTSGCNITFTTNDNDQNSVKIATLLES